jgi:Zn ribbon nucleic-acid-binding protein
MSSIIQFKCRSCETEIAIPAEPVSSVVCPACKAQHEVRIQAGLSQWKKVTQCVACGHEDFYVQKDFNRQLGLGIVVVGILVSTYFFNHRQAFYAMASLVATALIDLLIYTLVGSVTVCYSCHAVYRGFERNPEHEPFDLKKLEKFGGRTPRFGP